MYTQDTRALTRPQHPFDLPAVTVWTLAAVGQTSLRLANALDASITASEKRPRPVDTAIARRSHEDYLVPDAWRVR